jgi:hypothetical protein
MATSSLENGGALTMMYRYPGIHVKRRPARAIPLVANAAYR